MPNAAFEIRGTAAVITGAGSGIGRRIAEGLLEAGVNVVVNDRDEAALRETEADLAGTPGELRTLVGDASNPADMAALVEMAVDAFDGLDIVVNNVGIAGPTTPCEAVTPEELMHTLEVNVGGAVYATQAAIPHLRESPAGRVVTLSSVSGKRPLEYRIPYVISKMGLIGFTRTLAVELAGDGVTVNAICPGGVDGPRLDTIIRRQAETESRPFEDVKADFRMASPMGTLIDPEDIADTVVYLCSERAAKITGQDLNVSAGSCMG